MSWMRQPLARYAFALAMPLLATLLRLPVASFIGDNSPFVLLFPAITAAAWLGGFGPGLLATAVSLACAHVWVVAPHNVFSFAAQGEIARSVMFVTGGVVISLLCEQLHRARREVQRRADELERRVEERTASLRQALHDMEVFTFSVAHDLRGPLRAMRSYAEILQQEWQELDEAQRTQFIQRIISGADRMDQLTTDLLAYARVSSGEMSLVPLNVAQISGEILARYAEQADVECALDPAPWVLGCKTALEQTLANLIDNAVKFTPPGQKPWVRVASEQHGDRVRIWVEDHGIGIAPEYHDRVFQIFERLEPAKFAGTGVGLAIVQRAVERMNGRLGLLSSLGCGSCFWFELERVAAASPLPAVASAVVAPAPVQPLSASAATR